MSDKARTGFRLPNAVWCKDENDANCEILISPLVP
jgi:hypothetical protein